MCLSNRRRLQKSGMGVNVRWKNEKKFQKNCKKVANQIQKVPSVDDEVSTGIHLRSQRVNKKVSPLLLSSACVLEPIPYRMGS